MVTIVNLNYQKANIKITRPGPYGNIYTHLLNATAGFHVKDREEAVNRFAEFWYSEKARPLRERALREIPDGSTLGCVCIPKRCHGEIIAGYLNWKRMRTPPNPYCPLCFGCGSWVEGEPCGCTEVKS